MSQQWPARTIRAVVLANQGVDPMPMEAEEFHTFVNAESVSMAEFAKALNLKPQ